MNRKQKVLTIIALIAFVVIGACHYLAIASYAPWIFWVDPKIKAPAGFYMGGGGGGGVASPTEPLISDVRMPWFMLGVIYTGLFFLLADRKERR